MHDMFSHSNAGGLLATRAVLYVKNRIEDRIDRGATMAEYGLLLSFIALAAMGVLFAFGGQIRDLFAEVDDRLGKSPAFSSTTTGTAAGTSTGAAN